MEGNTNLNFLSTKYINKPGILEDKTIDDELIPPCNKQYCVSADWIMFAKLWGPEWFLVQCSLPPWWHTHMQNKKACNKQFSNNYSSYSQLQEINKDKISNKNKASLKYIFFPKYTCHTIINAINK